MQGLCRVVHLMSHQLDILIETMKSKAQTAEEITVLGCLQQVKKSAEARDRQQALTNEVDLDEIPF